MFTISLEEWKKLEWFDSGIEYMHFTPDCLWENDYSVVGEFKIDGINPLFPEYLFQKDGQLYIQRQRLAKVYKVGNRLLAGEKQCKDMTDLWEEKMTNEKIDYKIRVRVNGIVFCKYDARLYNFLKKNNVEFVPEFNKLKYKAAYIKHLDMFKMAVEKYPKYFLEYQDNKSIK